MNVLLRKAKSLLVLIVRFICNCSRVLMVRILNENATIPWSVEIGPGCLIRTTDGGTLVIGENVKIGGYSQLLVHRGRLVVAPRTYFGRGVNVVAQNEIQIGADVLIAEYVTIRDQDHDISEAGIPSLASFVTTPLRIGDGAWIAAKASILHGANIGEGAVVGAHSVVRELVEEWSVVVGIPAKLVRKRVPPT